MSGVSEYKLQLYKFKCHLILGQKGRKKLRGLDLHDKENPILLIIYSLTLAIGKSQRSQLGDT